MRICTLSSSPPLLHVNMCSIMSCWECTAAVAQYYVPDFHICELSTYCESATSTFGGTRLQEVRFVMCKQVTDLRSQEVLFVICEQVADLRSNSQLVGLVQIFP
jgi:hypothetical protein